MAYLDPDFRRMSCGIHEYIDSFGECLGCRCEKERELNGWWVDSATYGAPAEIPDLRWLAKIVMAKEIQHNGRKR